MTRAAWCSLLWQQETINSGIAKRTSILITEKLVVGVLLDSSCFCHGWPLGKRVSDGNSRLKHKLLSFNLPKMITLFKLSNHAAYLNLISIY